MQVSEEQRRRLHERLRERLDDATATLLMEMTVPANVDLATRSDLRELRAELLLGIAELGERIGARFAGLEERTAGIDGRLVRVEAGILGLDVSMKHRLCRVVLPTVISVQLALFALSEFALR